MVIALSVSLFAGCTKSETNSTDTATNKEAEAETTTNSEKEQKEVLEAELEKEEVTLTLFHHMSEEAKRNGIEALAAGFAAQNPEVTMDIQAMDFGQYASTLKTKIAADDAPDIFFGRPKSYTDMVQAGHVMEITTQEYLGSMHDTALPALTINGGVYGILLDVSALGTFYNKDLFAEHGLQKPETYADLMDACEVFKAAGINAFSRGFKDAWTAQVEYSALYQGLVFADDQNWMQDVTDGEKKFADYPGIETGFQVWQDILPYSNDDIFGTDYSKSIELFATGQAAMFSQGMWALGEIRKISPELNLGFMVPPATDNPSSNKLPVFGDDGFMMSSATKHPEYANAFFEFCLSDEGVAIWADTAGQVSFQKDSSYEYTDSATLDFLAYMDSGMTVNQEAGAFFSGQMDATFREYQELFPALEGKDVKEFIAEMDAEFDAIRD